MAKRKGCLHTIDVTFSDYDYIFPDLEGVEDYLKFLGFYRIPIEDSNYPWSAGIVAMYENDDYHKDPSSEKERVQVLIRKDFDAFVEMWENLDVNFWHDYIWKRSPTKPDRNMRHRIIEELLKMQKNY